MKDVETLTGDKIAFTANAWDSFYTAVDNPDFADMDAAMIYKTLLDCIRKLSFGDYLRRYIYFKAGMEEEYDRVTEDTYESILRNAFRDTGTPCSFPPSTSTTKVSVLAHNCLSKATVKRDTLLLLGFALRMNEKDVNSLLTKGLGEPVLDVKSPREIICKWCYMHEYPFSRYLSLWQSYLELPALEENAARLDSELTSRYGARLHYAAKDTELIEYLRTIKIPEGKARLSVSAGQAFLKLYDEAKRITAHEFNAAADRDFEYEFTRRAEQIADDAHYQKAERIQALRRSRGTLTADDITEADLETVLCANVPKDKNGNLTPADESALAPQFSRCRVSRQRIHNILSGKIPVARFDLITLLFYIWGHRVDKYPIPQSRLNEFENAADALLTSCGMDEMYIQNPYECFILMCMVSEDPLGAYAEVWELSYLQSQKNAQKNH